MARARENGAERIAVVYDREIYGRELAGQIVARARDAGLEVGASEQYGGNVDDIPDLASALAEGRPDAVLYAGVAGSGTGRLLAAIDSGMPGVPVYAASGILARDAPIPAAPERVEAVGPRLSPGAGRLPRDAARARRHRGRRARPPPRDRGRAADRPERGSGRVHGVPAGPGWPLRTLIFSALSRGDAPAGVAKGD